MSSLANLGITVLDTDKHELIKSFPVEVVGGTHDFKITLAYLSRDGLGKINERNRRVVWSKELSRQVEEMDENGMAADLAKVLVRDWAGLNVGVLRRMMPVQITKEGITDASVIACDVETATMLMIHAADFAKWIVTVATDPARFMDVQAVPRSAPSKI